MRTDKRSTAAEMVSELSDIEFGTQPSGFLVQLRTDFFQLCTRESHETGLGFRVRTIGDEIRTSASPQNGFGIPDWSSAYRRRTDLKRVCTSGTPRSAFGGCRIFLLTQSARLEPGEPRKTP
ncbi:MAG: hypothetical protein ABJC13_07720 [Acidobacteriota bacterium]